MIGKDGSGKIAEWSVITLMIILVAIGAVAGFINPEWFTEVYTREDGLVESLTAVALFAAAVIVFVKMWQARGESNLRTACHTVFILMLLFGAGEEISWGQRIFDIESGEFFLRHNAQGETNLHNLIVGETKINKLVFGQILTVVVTIYFLILPLMFGRIKPVTSLVNRLGVPVPRLHQSLIFITLYLVTMIIPAGRKWELGEMVLAMTLVIVVLDARNNMGISYRKESLADTSKIDNPD